MNHPMQRIEVDKHGVCRFKANAIVRFLLDDGPNGMNRLAIMPFSEEDRMQFAQLIGYSVSGFGDLSYADPAVVAEADAKVEAAYPFGTREHLPYKMWCSEVRKALGIGVPSGPVMWFSRHGVLCLSCQQYGAVAGGCLFCRPLEEKLSRWKDWNNGAAVEIARRIRDEQGTRSLMPILADALEEAGCTEDELLEPLRSKDAKAVAVEMLAGVKPWTPKNRKAVDAIARA